MKIKGLIDEDFIQYKKPSMFIATTKCTFKCDKECGKAVCQNSALANSPIITLNNNQLIERYLHNPITSAIVVGGLEPFDEFIEVYRVFCLLRDGYRILDDFIIYTGYYPSEIQRKLNLIKSNFASANLILKFGRFIPEQTPRFDEVLGVQLSSPNQFAVEFDKYSIEELIELEKKYHNSI